ncbi:DNA ligase 1 [Canna indica]|uniref:DNA ligase 1 n=1 Tax=Canna indica TaxID=4628 RepID=A0AAQ3Q9L9_9LILI|nr:DNA ligase 1 [Canna indica]
MEVDEEVPKAKEAVEAEISRAMRARVSDFKERADTLTLEGVRRALEKDLGMKTFSLDAHKRFIKQCLDECFYGANDENVVKISGENASQSANVEKSRQSEDNQPPVPDESRKASSGFGRETEDSPASGEKVPKKNLNLLKDETINNQDTENDVDLNEEKIRKAIQSRAEYFRANSASISLASVRRLLEEDLKLEMKALDAYKSFITKELDKALEVQDVMKPTNGIKKQPKKISQKKDVKRPDRVSKRGRSESDSSDTNDSASEDEEDEDPKPKKKLTEKTKVGTKGPKRLKKSEEKSSSSSERKTGEQDPENGSEDESGNSSGDSHYHSSKGDAKKKQEKPTQVYGKRVEHLKSIIKSCGMGVPPTVYRRAKQVSESKREAYLIKELEEILKKEGLTINPSEKEIKAVKKKKERARELEGIDMSNIVSSSRRRTASSYIPLPKPKIEVESEEEEEEEEEEENEEETDDENEDDVSGSGPNDESDEGDEEESD